MEMRRREPGLVSREAGQAGEFEELFRAVYLTFHRGDGPRSQLPGASAAVLEHLPLAGPLTAGEAAAHLRRAVGGQRDHRPSGTSGPARA